MKDFYRCTGCGNIFHDDDMLRAYQPFRDGETVYGCPNCKEIEELVGICEAPGCKEDATVGQRWPDGEYRKTCWFHREDLAATKPAYKPQENAQ